MRSPCVTYATEREKKGGKKERERKREIRRARASRDRVIISPLNFSIPHPFTHPAATSSFLRESPRGIAVRCIPDVFLTLLLTRISGRRYRDSVLSLSVDTFHSIHPISAFRPRGSSRQRDVTMSCKLVDSSRYRLFFLRRRHNGAPSIWNVTCSPVDEA